MPPWQAGHTGSPVIMVCVVLPCTLLERAGEPFAGQSPEESPVVQGEVSSASVLAVLGSRTKEGSPVHGAAVASASPH